MAPHKVTSELRHYVCQALLLRFSPQAKGGSLRQAKFKHLLQLVDSAIEEKVASASWEMNKSIDIGTQIGPDTFI